MQTRLFSPSSLLLLSYSVYFSVAQSSIPDTAITGSSGQSSGTFSFPVLSLEQAVAPPDGSLASRAATGHPQLQGTVAALTLTGQQTVYPIDADNAALLALYGGAHQYGLDQWNQGHQVGEYSGDYFRFTSSGLSMIVHAVGEAAEDATNLDWGQFASIAEGMYNYTKANPSLATSLQGFLQMDDGSRGADVLTTVSMVDIPAQNANGANRRHRLRRDPSFQSHSVNIQPRAETRSIVLTDNYKMAWRSSPTRLAGKLFAKLVISAWGAIMGDWNVERDTYEYYRHDDQRGGPVFEIVTTGVEQITRQTLEDMMTQLLSLQTQERWASSWGSMPGLDGELLDPSGRPFAKWTLGTALPAAVKGVRNYLCSNPDGSMAIACFAKKVMS